MFFWLSNKKKVIGLCNNVGFFYLNIFNKNKCFIKMLMQFDKKITRYCFWFYIKFNFNLLVFFKIKCKVEKNEHFWHFLLIKFNFGFKALTAVRNIWTVYEQNVINKKRLK